MNGKNLFAVIGAIIVGIVAFWLVGKIIGFVITMAWWLILGGIAGGIAYLAYRKFNSMLSSGKRLT